MSPSVQRSGGTAPQLLVLPLVGDDWSASHPGLFTPGETARGTHWIGRRVGGSHSRSGSRGEKYLTPPPPPTANQNLFPQLSNLQPFHYTDWAMLAVYSVLCYKPEGNGFHMNLTDVGRPSKWPLNIFQLKFSIHFLRETVWGIDPKRQFVGCLLCAYTNCSDTLTNSLHTHGYAMFQSVDYTCKILTFFKRQTYFGKTYRVCKQLKDLN
jgi:hypothetical protein